MNHKNIFDDYINEYYTEIAKMLRSEFLSYYDPYITPHILATILEKCRINENDNINEVVFKSFVLNGTAQRTKDYITDLGYRTETNSLFTIADITDIIFYKKSEDRILSILAKSMYSQIRKTNFLNWEIEKLVNGGELSEYEEEQNDYHNFLNQSFKIPMTYLLNAIENNDYSDIHKGFHEYCSAIVKEKITKHNFDQFRGSILGNISGKLQITYQVHYIENVKNDMIRDLENNAYYDYYGTTKIKAHFEKIVEAQMKIIITNGDHEKIENPSIYFVEIGGKYYFLHQQAQFLNTLIGNIL